VDDGLITIVEVESSAISSIGYDSEASELYVRFRGGEAYTYRGVPEAEWLALCEAESKGAFVNRTIKPQYEVREGAPI
jgi:hypothetical protein